MRGLLSFLCVFVFTTASSYAAGWECRRELLRDLISVFPERDRAEMLTFAEPTFGIELEGSVPILVGRAGITEVLKRTLADEGFQTGSIPNRSGFVVAARRGKKKHQWRVIWDHSVKPVAEDHEAIEIISPILKSKGDFVTYARVVEACEEAGLVAAPRTAGVHIHVDFSKPKAAEMLGVIHAFSLIENELMQRFGTLASRMEHTGPTSDIWLDAAQRFLSEKNEREFWSFYNGLKENANRKHALNPMAFFRHGTLEFRLFNSTVRVEHIGVMKDFCRKFVWAIRSKNRPLIEYLTGDKPIRVQEVARLIGASHGAELDRVFEELHKDVQPYLTAQAAPSTQGADGIGFVLTVQAVDRAASVVAP